MGRIAILNCPEYEYEHQYEYEYRDAEYEYGKKHEQYRAPKRRRCFSGFLNRGLRRHR